LKARGNLTEVEKVLGVSYPTIRNKLDEINNSLERANPMQPAVTERPAAEPGTAPAAIATGSEDARRAILQQVAAGQLSATEAAKKLREVQGGQ
jgi:hypothetical protein